jgi:hypothetical protein
MAETIKYYKSNFNKMPNLIYTYFKKHIHILFLTICFVVVFTHPSLSQNNEEYTHASLAEKIYLQLDSKIYTMDQTIWFKSIVTNAVNHAPTILSGVLNVELIDPDEKIIEKKLIKIERGIGDGFFQLHPSYSEGLYLIRAYTEWNKNFSSDFFFKEYIQVFATSSKKELNPISDVTLIEKQNYKRRLQANLNPFAIDSLHKKELMLFITLSNKKDTLSIKKTGMINTCLIIPFRMNVSLLLYKFKLKIFSGIQKQLP